MTHQAMKAYLIMFALVGVFLAATTPMANAAESRADAIMKEISELRGRQNQNVTALNIDLAQSKQAEKTLQGIESEMQDLAAEGAQIDSETRSLMSRWSCTPINESAFSCPCETAECMDEVNQSLERSQDFKSRAEDLMSRHAEVTAEKEQADQRIEDLKTEQEEIATQITKLEGERRALQHAGRGGISDAERRAACEAECAQATSPEFQSQCMLRCTAGARSPSGMGTVEQTLPQVEDQRPFGTGGRPTAKDAKKGSTEKTRPKPQGFHMKEPPKPQGVEVPPQ